MRKHDLEHWKQIADALERMVGHKTRITIEDIKQAASVNGNSSAENALRRMQEAGLVHYEETEKGYRNWYLGSGE